MAASKSATGSKKAAASTASKSKSKAAGAKGKAKAKAPQAQAQAQARPQAQAQARPQGQAQAVRAPQARRDRVDNTCRKGLYQEYRNQCQALQESGQPCYITERCSKWGVGVGEGSLYWPVSAHWPSADVVRHLGADTVREGSKCASRAIWQAEGFEEREAKECNQGTKRAPEQKPGYLDQKSRNPQSVRAKALAPMHANAAAPAAGQVGQAAPAVGGGRTRTRASGRRCGR